MLLNKDDRKVLRVTALAIVLLVSGLYLSHVGSTSGSKSAVLLAQSSYKSEKEHLAQQAQQLGLSPTAEAIEAQQVLLRSRMEGLGATSEEAEGVLETVRTSKKSTIDWHGLLAPPIWPLVVGQGYVKGNRVWVIHCGHWLYDESNPPKQELSCGTGIAPNDPLRWLQHSTYVVDTAAPYHCWLAPFMLEMIPPDEQKNYIRDDEYLLDTF